MTLSHLDTWIFDLDNTLYPPHINLFEKVDARMKTYIARLLDLPVEEAFRVQKEYYHRYGTTLRGLMLEHKVDPHDFLEYVHDIDHSPLEPDPALGEALANLPGRKFILTNGSRTHASNIIEKLAIPQHFEDIYDIIAADFEPKPSRGTYERFISKHGVSAGSAIMFEDLPKNLKVPKELGMTTVLVVPQGKVDPTRQSDYIDIVIDDLTAFLAGFDRT